MPIFKFKKLDATKKKDSHLCENKKIFYVSNGPQADRHVVMKGLFGLTHSSEK